MVSGQSRNPYLRANSLFELLSWHDADFVRCAYVTVLGRQPDAEGEAYYTHRIRQGHSKLQILWQLRRSPEATRHDPGIAGFDRALRKSRLERSRVGWPMRQLTRGEGDTAAWRRHRMVINELGRHPPENARTTDPELTADLRILTAQLGVLTETVGRFSSGQMMPANSTPTHGQFLENPDYRNLSSRSRKIFRKVHAHSY